MKSDVIEDIKTVINLITHLECRSKTFVKELNFFDDEWPGVVESKNQFALNCYASALRRLGHEVMFLCIETYSLHKGIINIHGSLASKSIKHGQKTLSEVKKTRTSKDHFTHLGFYRSDGWREEATAEDIESAIRASDERTYAARRELRDELGLTNHKAVDKWCDSMRDDANVKKLGCYRDKHFAHRFDTLKAIKSVRPDILQSPEIREILTITNKTCGMYKKTLQKFLSYTRGEYYQGIAGLIYDSLDRLELSKKTSYLRNKLLA